MNAPAMGMPNALPVLPQSIPDALKEVPQWVAWRYTRRDSKWTKPPVNIRTGGPADSTNPGTWGTFGEALSYAERNHLPGVGFNLTADRQIVATDIDHCRDATTGEIKPDALQIIDTMRSYTEVSPSGTGIRIMVGGGLPVDGKRRGPIEMYQSKRYVTLTGHHLPGTPDTIEANQPALDALYARLAASPTIEPGTGGGNRHNTPDSGSHPLEDGRVIELARSAGNGTKFRALYDHGDASAYDGDDSRADAALVGMLSFWTRDAAQITRLLWGSSLRRDKWARPDYLPRTIDTVLRRGGEQYSGALPLPSLVSSRLRQDAQPSGGAGETDGGGATLMGEIDGLPDIPITDRHLRDVVADAQAALSTANDPPSLFTYGGLPARTRRDETGALGPDQLSVDALRGELSKRANFLAYDRRRKSLKPAFPPVDMVRTVLAAAEHPLPRLAGFVGTPVMRPDGTLLDSPGYCRQTFLIYDPAPSLRIPAIAAAPSAREANFAAAYLADELMPDFPFVDDASRAHAIAKLILPFARELIDGPTPLHLVEAPECGSGKGLLDDVTALPAFGTGLSGITEPGDDDEWRKTLISALRGGSRYLRIDNLTLPLESGTLASALTAHVFEGRVLGGSQMARFRVRWVWSATANNPVLSSDIARRTVRIRIDPKEEQPWLRSGFRHTDLRGWAVSHRGELIAAALTMIRAWIVAGRPAGQNAALGSYEAWSAVMGGILHHAGIDGFLGGLRDAYTEVDREMDAWRGLVHRWHETYGTKPVEASTLFAQAAAVAEIDLGAGNERSQRINFGKLLGRQQGRVIAGFRIEKGTLKHGMQQWLLVAV